MTVLLVPFPLEYALYRIFVSPVSHSRASRNPELEAAFQYQQIYLETVLADEILRLCDVEDKSKAMIDPFCPSRLRPASYQLTLGDEIHVGGEYHSLSKSGPVTLPPHQVAVVSTHEELRIPEHLVARWSLRVAKIYEGLLWTGGPQVDPGWNGQLFCPIYNLAERNVVLKCGDPLFTIDFVRTTDVSGEYNRLKEDPTFPEIPFSVKRRNLADHDRYQLHSAPYEELRALGGLTDFRNFAIALFAVMFTAIAAVVAAVGVIATGPIAPDNGELLGVWPLTALAGSAFAVVLSVFSIILQVCSMRQRRP